MTMDEMDVWRSLLEAEAKAKIDRQVFEKRLEIRSRTLGTETKKRKTKVEKFIEKHPDMEPETVQFIGNGEASTKVVSAFLETCGVELHPDTIGRKVGIDYKSGKNSSSGRKLICTISVVERHGLNGSPAKE